MNILAFVGSSDSYTVPMTMVILGIVVVISAIAHIVQSHLPALGFHVVHTIRCNDGEVCPFGHEIEPEAAQLPRRITGNTVRVYFPDVCCFQLPNQRIGESVDAEETLRRLRDGKIAGGRLWFYTDDVARFVESNPERYPHSWRNGRVIFPGKTYRSNEIGRFWFAISWDRRNERPVVTEAPFALGFGPDDFFACLILEDTQDLKSA